MDRFGDDNKKFFDGVYQNDVPWEIGGIQPALLDVIKDIPPFGKILDIGCGNGDASIDMARLGYEVIGIDFIEKAIAGAKEKTGGLGEIGNSKISFICGDGLKPSRYGKDFGAIIDSGFMHLFDDETLYNYVQELYSALVDGGRVYLIEFSHDFKIPNAPRSIDRELLNGLFDIARWNVLLMSDCRFVNKVAPVPAIVACFEKRPT